MPLLAATRIVLIHPTLPENVGAVARGMRHFGLEDLVLVGGVAPTHSLAVAASAGAETILQAARVVDSFEAALAGTVLALGTTARPQAGVERRAILPEEGVLWLRGPSAAVPCAGRKIYLYPPEFLQKLADLWQDKQWSAQALEWYEAMRAGANPAGGEGLDDAAYPWLRRAQRRAGAQAETGRVP